MSHEKNLFVTHFTTYSTVFFFTYSAYLLQGGHSDLHNVTLLCDHHIYMHSLFFKYNQPYMMLSNASTIEKQCYLGTSQQHNNQLKQITGGSCQVDRGITEGRMPGEYAGHHWKAGSGITLCAAHNRLQKWGNFLFSQISYCGLILCFTKPCFKSAIFI